MPFLLILIRKSRWRGTTTEFRGAPDIPADCLFDLKIENNELSAWHVDDERINLIRILTALAATKDTDSNLDYITFNYDLPANFGIKLRKTKGETPDTGANGQWHYDLVELSARQVVELAVEIYHSGARDRLGEKLVGPLIKEGVQKSELDQTKIKSKLAQKLFPAYRRRQTYWASIRQGWTEFRQFFSRR